MAYAVYDNDLISKNNVFAFEYLFNTVQPFGVDETMIGAIAKTGSCWTKSKSWHFPP
jgi:non-canonical (house-cleaning) NTP pyrophosphatase